jgi:hypothetical protein
VLASASLSVIIVNIYAFAARYLFASLQEAASDPMEYGT